MMSVEESTVESSCSADTSAAVSALDAACALQAATSQSPRVLNSLDCKRRDSNEQSIPVSAATPSHCGSCICLYHHPRMMLAAVIADPADAGAARAAS